MTITHIMPRSEYTADGLQTSFDFPFRLFELSDIKIFVNNIEINSGFTLTKNETGGNLNFNNPPMADSKIIIVRDLKLKRQTDFQQSTKLKASDLNLDLDYLTACLQDMDERFNRVPYQKINKAVKDLMLPEPESGKAMVWNETGDGLENTELNIKELLSIADTAVENTDIIFQNIKTLLKNSTDAGVLGLISNFSELIKASNPEAFLDYGWTFEAAGLSDNYGQVSETATETVNYD